MNPADQRSPVQRVRSIEIDGSLTLESAGHRYEVRGAGDALVLHAPGLRAAMHLARSGRRVRRDLGRLLAGAATLYAVTMLVKVRGRTIARTDDGRIRVHPFALLLAGLGRERPSGNASGR
ncbi:MAG: hypothetical protein EA380_03785 [Phycisphaeraceae bacterium]|nr:MAG: hypothetical protein EA380_03785 [Phycisphaeraceae bacterium]